MSTSGDIMSTLGNVQYIGGCSVHRGISWVHWGMFSILGGYHEYIGGVQYIGGSMSTLGWYHEYIGGVQYIRGISWCMRGSKMVKTFQFLLKTPMYWISPNVLMISPQCTHDIPQCTHGIPLMYWTSPWCTHGILPMYWAHPDVLMIFPDVLMVSLRCTEHPWCTHDIPQCTEHPPPPQCTHDISPMYSWYPPMYWTSPNVQNTHYTRWLFCLYNRKSNIICGLLDFVQCAVFSKGFWDSCVDTVKAVIRAVVWSTSRTWDNHLLFSMYVWWR